MMNDTALSTPLGPSLYYALISTLFLSLLFSFHRSLLLAGIAIPGPELPAPSAYVWLNFAAALNGASLPPHVLPFCGIAMVTGLILGSIRAIGPLIVERRTREALRKKREREILSSGGKTTGEEEEDPTAIENNSSWLSVAVEYCPSGVAIAIGG